MLLRDDGCTTLAEHGIELVRCDPNFLFVRLVGLFLEVAFEFAMVICQLLFFRQDPLCFHM